MRSPRQAEIDHCAGGHADVLAELTARPGCDGAGQIG